MTLEKTLLDPTTNTYKPKEGKASIVRIEIFVDKIELSDIPIMQLMETTKEISEIDSIIRHLAYEWIETVNGIEVFCENPRIKNASDQDYDIKEAIEKELGFRIDHLNYID